MAASPTPHPPYLVYSFPSAATPYKVIVTAGAVGLPQAMKVNADGTNSLPGYAQSNIRAYMKAVGKPQTVLAYCQLQVQDTPVTTGGNPLDPTNIVNDTINNGAVKGAVSAVDSVTNFFGLLTSAAFWVRVGELSVGLIVVGVGASALLKQSTGIDPVKVAKKTPFIPV